MQRVLTSLGKSVPLIINLIMFTLAYLITQSLIPLKYLKGQFYSCKSMSEESLVKTSIDCYDQGGDWIRYDFHWDNIQMALFNMFTI